MTPDDYIEIRITILDDLRSTVKVKRSLSISRLIEEILKEFKDLDHANPLIYAIYNHGSENPFPNQATLAKLDIRSQDELDFRYVGISGRRPLKPDQYFFLTDETGKTHEVTWYPAVLGRPTGALEENSLLAVDLQFHRDGQKISRRHAKIAFMDGEYYIESLSAENPTYINNDPLPIKGLRKISNGDHIYLGKPKIKLTFLTAYGGNSSRTSTNEPQLEKSKTAKIGEEATILDLSQPQIRITFIAGEASHKGPFVVKNFPYFIGREMTEVKLEDGAISRRHACIKYDSAESHFTITDLNSRNGVLINGEKIAPDKPVFLSTGMVVSLGQKTQFRFDEMER